MTAQAASATYSLITYSNAYYTVAASEDALQAPAIATTSVRFIDVLRDAAESLLRYLSQQRLRAQRNASLRLAAREGAMAEQYARGMEQQHPAMAQELRAAAAHRMGQFDY